MSRVVVIGAGLGGAFAALAAQETDPTAEVHLVAVSPERYRYEPGTVDLLGAAEPADNIVEQPLSRIGDLPSDHPYSLVGSDSIRRAIDYFDDLLGDDDRLCYNGTERNALCPTVTGTVRPTYRYPDAVAAGVVSRQRPMHIVGLDCLNHLDAELAADRLDSSLPYDVNASTVSFPIETQERPPFEALGNALDANPETDDGTRLRDALAQAVRPRLDTEPRVGLPPVLGVSEHDAIRRELTSTLQASVFEIPVGECSLPGIRLRKRLFDLVTDAGIELKRATIESVRTTENRVQALTLTETDSGAKRSIDAESVVLATGGVSAGGITATGTEVVEPVFDCSVSQPADHDEWSVPAALGDHAVARFGVDVTPTLQPKSGDGPKFENLYTAGSVISGGNFVAERSRTGVQVVTGHQAGRNAVDW